MKTASVVAPFRNKIVLTGQLPDLWHFKFLQGNTDSFKSSFFVHRATDLQSWRSTTASHDFYEHRKKNARNIPNKRGVSCHRKVKAKQAGDSS
jgi:hypothetical protein